MPMTISPSGMVISFVLAGFYFVGFSPGSPDLFFSMIHEGPSWISLVIGPRPYSPIHCVNLLCATRHVPTSLVLPALMAPIHQLAWFRLYHLSTSLMPVWRALPWVVLYGLSSNSQAQWVSAHRLGGPLRSPLASPFSGQLVIT